MATKHPRINITIEEEYLGQINELAKMRNQSVASTAKSLMLEALELQEDLYFSRLAEEVESKTTKWVSHEDAWK